MNSPQLHYLDKVNDNTFNITHKKPFGQGAFTYKLTEDEIYRCLQFCWQMTFGESGAHREHRSGGSVSRDAVNIFKDAFIGKVGEITFYHLCKARGKSDISAVDFDCYGKGKWDTSDFFITFKGKEFKVAVKTTKHFGNLLLLETKDWEVKDGKAIYLPNYLAGDDLTGDEADSYSDFIIFCRVKTDIYDKSLVTDNDLQLESNLARLAQTIVATGEVVGYLKNKQLVEMIDGDYRLPKGALLNGKIPMDAENYYVQSGCFNGID